LTSLSAAANETLKGAQSAAQASESAEKARVKVVAHYQALAAGLEQSALQTAEVGTLWASYYRALSDGARAEARESAAPPNAVPPARPINPAPANPGGGPPITGNLPPVNGNTAPQRAPQITPLPLSRYTGAWVYPTSGAQYHGTPPSFVDLVVREEEGRFRGTLFARFELPQNGPVEPTLRFDFEGPLQKTRNQVFPLETSEGAKGTVELIPGPAFNLLEISFSTEGSAKTVRQGNFLLIKK